jgi:hypothetical protein
MSYYFTCVIAKTADLTPPVGYAARPLGRDICLVWQPDAGRVPNPESVSAMVAELSPQCSHLLHITYDDGCGIREATIYEAGIPVRSFGEGDELWVPVDESGYPITDAPALGPDDLDDDDEYDCVRCGIAAALDVFLGADRVSVGQIRDVICKRGA